MLSIFRLSFFVLFIIGCNRSPGRINVTESLETKKITVNTDEPEKNRFEDFFAIDRFVQLETNEACFMSDINKLLTTEDSTIIVWDKSQEAVFSFDKDGGFLYSIKALGKGPEEYRGITDVTYNKEKRCITVLDVASRALVCFSIEDGSFLQRLSFQGKDFPGYTLDYVPGNFYLFNRMNTPHPRYNDSQMIAIDGDDLKVMAVGLPRLLALENNRVKMTRTLDVRNERAYMVDLLNDTVYTFHAENQEFLPEFSFSYDVNVANKVAAKIKSGDNSYKDDVYPYLIEDGGVSSMSNLFLISDYIYFSFTYQRRGYSNIYKESDGETYRVPSQLEFSGQSIIGPPLGKLGDDLLIGKVFPKKIDDAFLSKNPELCFYRIAF